MLSSAIIVVVVGTMVGVEFAVAVFVEPIFNRLPLEAGIAARSDGARVLGRVMPFWYVASLILVVGWSLFTWGQPASTPTLISAILLAVSVVLSILFLVPINSRIKRWSAGEVPDDWREQMRRWNRLHYLRVAILIAAFVLAAVALTMV
jgi:uncharacterized membrane protein